MAEKQETLRSADPEVTTAIALEYRNVRLRFMVGDESYHPTQYYLTRTMKIKDCWCCKGTGEHESQDGDSGDCGVCAGDGYLECEGLS